MKDPKTIEQTVAAALQGQGVELVDLVIQNQGRKKLLQFFVDKDGGVTLDALVSELIKPYLKAWLDQNLPAIVDEAVQKEIARLVERSIR